VFKRKPVEVLPSARRMVTSLRDVGYDFVHAVADIVDNSIEADATEVNVQMRFDGTSSWLSVSDNGTGMSDKGLVEAMRFGSQREYGPSELGRFGLGLKTASLSQCNRLTVASRTHPSRNRIAAYYWDVHHVVASDRWEILPASNGDLPRPLVNALKDAPGTVVLWQGLERVLDYKVPEGDRAKKGFLELTAELDAHLGMVFHRFLAGEVASGRKLQLWVNDAKTPPWDPFARSEDTTIVVPDQEFVLEVGSYKGVVRCRPYILPPKDSFSTLEAFTRHSGPLRWNEQQGFYIYRADRMIQSGGWCHMRTPDEHTKLARIALDFQPELDFLFDLNVTKARVALPGELKAHLKPLIEKLAGEARRAYDKKDPRTRATLFPVVGHDSTSPSHHPHPPAEEAASPVFDGRIAAALDDAAKKCEAVSALRRIQRVVVRDQPDVAKTIGWQK